MWIINNNNKSIEYNGESICIPRKEFMIIAYFQENPNRIINRQELLKNIWGDDIVVGERTIDVHIRRLRKRFPDAPITTRKCYGYMWKSLQ
jgi:two-component system alkaline phosphatase synthesis response regulator PhoP